MFAVGGASLREDPNSSQAATAFRTTDGTIALLNLQAQVESLELLAVRQPPPYRTWGDLVDLLAVRGQLLGRIVDYERAASLAEQLADAAPANGLAFLTRARTRATFHRFQDVLADLERAERLGMLPSSLAAERAAALHQLGRADEALALGRASADRWPSFTTLGALAVLHAERGETATAEPLFAASRARYRSVSPFPLAQLDFQCGRMWLVQGDYRRARTWFEAAARRVPAFAPAQGHLAETEAAMGEADAAIARLRPLTVSADDPDYAALLARLLAEAGRAQEAQTWRALAAARYEELVARHPEAFTDHAAEFWLTVGGDPTKALRLARRNFEVRRTPRARELLSRASLASDAVRAAQCCSLEPVHPRATEN